MLQTYEFTIGDGHHPCKDGVMTFTATWALRDLDTLIRKLAIARFPDYEREIEWGWTDDTAEGDGVRLVIDEGPTGETDGYAGPWLVAKLRRVAEIAREEEGEATQLDLATVWGEAA